MDLIDEVRAGLPVSAADEAVQSGRLTAAELDRLVVPRKTLAHRREIGTLSAEQSDRLVRVLRLIIEAEQVFGSRDKAYQWLRRDTRPLVGRKPLDLLDTDLGTRRVETLLGRVAHGIAA